MKTVKIDVGCHTPLEIDVSAVDFGTCERVIMSFRNYKAASPAFVREFFGAGIYTVTVTPEESEMLRGGARCSFTAVLRDGTRHVLGDDVRIRFRRGCV